MKIPVIDEKHFLENINNQKNPHHAGYLAFYSSWFGGILRNPAMMMLPIDDHMVHRGDGIFEAMKSVGRSVYLLDEHLARLVSSAEKIFLKLPFSVAEIKEIILETLRAANASDTIIRMYVSRGPGGFSVNPYDSIASQLYIVITRLDEPSAEKYTQGVIVGKSAVISKFAWMPQVKSCNYLPNVLMKKEAVDRDLDFVVGVDEEGCVTEGATENIMIVNQQGVIVHPLLEHILKGTTMVRACELARENGLATEVKPISLEDLLSAREVMITGTSLNVLPVVKFEDQLIGDGRPGPVAKKLQALLLEDIKLGKKGTPF